jgi:hypothetical protein
MIKHRLKRIEATLNRCASPGRRVPPRPLQSAQDVVALLHEQVEAVRAAPWTDPLDRARAIAYLAGVARKAIEAGILAARVEMLETVLNQRKDQRSR